MQDLSDATAWPEASNLSAPITAPGMPSVIVPKPLARSACRRFNWKSFMQNSCLCIADSSEDFRASETVLMGLLDRHDRHDRKPSRSDQRHTRTHTAYRDKDKLVFHILRKLNINTDRHAFSRRQTNRCLLSKLKLPGNQLSPTRNSTSPANIRRSATSTR